MATYARIMLGATLVACTGDDTVELTPDFLVSDASIRLEEDGTASVVLSAEVSNTDESPTYQIITEPSLGSLLGNDSGSVFQYTPEPDANGEDSFTWRAFVGDAQSEEAVVTIFVEPVNDAPVGQADAINTTEDTPVSDLLPATDVEGDALNYLLVSAPEFGRIDLGADGTYTYTPEQDYVGEDSFLWAAQDPSGASTGPIRVDITIGQENDQPVVQSNGFVGTEDTLLIGELIGSDPDGDSLLWSIAAQPANGNLTIDPGVGRFEYLPGPNFFGSDSFEVRANDGIIDSEPARIDITITSVNDAPSVAALNIVTDEDSSIDGQLVGTDVEGSPITYRVDQSPRSGLVSLNQASGAFTYTPNPNANGSDDFTVIVNDGTGDSLPALIIVSITPVNDAPVLSSDGLLTTNEDNSVNGSVTGTDIENNALTFAVSTLPSNGSVTISGATGSLAYTPNPNFNGQDSFAVTANDGIDNSLPAVVDVLVLPVNDPPVPGVVVLSTITGAPAEVMLIASDPEGDVLSFQIVDAPNNGTALVDAATGLVQYQPDPGYNGSDVMVWSVSDGDLAAEGILPILVSNDSDGDSIGNNIDNCPDVPNLDQSDVSNNGVGDVCDCYEEQFTDTLNDEFFANSNNISLVEDRVTSDSHSLRLNGNGAFVETVVLPGCGSYLYELQVAAGPPAPQADDKVVISVRLDGGPWLTLAETFGTGLEEPFATVRGQTSEVIDLSGGDVEFRIEVDGDEPNDLFFIDDLKLECDEDSDFLPDCVESGLAGYDLTVADADGDGVIDSDEFAAGTDPNIGDSDFDNISDATDNCPRTFNPDQADLDGSGNGDLCDPGINEDFASGEANTEFWTTNQPIGDGEITNLSSTSDRFSMRLSHGIGGELVSNPIDLSFCNTVAYFFQRQKGTDAPGTIERLKFQVWDGQTWIDLYDEVGNFQAAPYIPIIGNTTEPFARSTAAQFRFMTNDTNFSTGDDDWFIDDVWVGCDPDGDGIPTAVEANRFGTNPVEADTDGDGTDDLTEVLAGTDPTRLPPVDLPIVDNFESGMVNAGFWTSAPTGDGEVSSNFADTDTFSLRLGDNGAILESLDGDFESCTFVAWDFRLRTGDAPEEPEATDLLRLEVLDRSTFTWTTVTEIAGGAPFAFDPILGNSQSPEFGTRNGTQIRLTTPNTGNGTDSDSWYVDDLYIGCDEDNDLIPDGKEELVYGTDPNNPDTDGDGVLDGAEVLAGTNPSPVIFDDFRSGNADLVFWSGPPVGDAMVSSNFANSDTFSLRVGDSGGSITSTDVNFGLCPLGVAWDFRLRTGDGTEAPDAADILDVEVFDAMTMSYVNLASIAGGVAYNFDPILGNSSNVSLDALTNIRIITQNTSNGVDNQAWYIDDIAFGCDNDTDMIPDFIEQSVYGTFPNVSDTDEDGVKDGAEIVAGTNPVDQLISFGIFEDFESGTTPNPAVWASFVAPTAIVDDGPQYRRGNFSMRTNDGSATTVDFDLSQCAAAVVTFEWIDRDLDFNDDVQIEYFDGVGFVNIGTILGSGLNGTWNVFNASITSPSPLPTNLSLRISSQVSFPNGDRGYIDNLSVDCDSDADGLGNSLEAFTLGTDATGADTDGDGVDDGVEVLAGTDPLDPSDF